MKIVRIVLQVLIALFLVGGGMGAAYWLILMKPQPPRSIIEEMELPVEVVSANAGDFPISIEGFGTVKPEQEIVLQPQVSGLVVEQSDSLIPGGQFQEGDVILRIDSRDYQFSVEQREENVERAQMQLKEELSRKEIAEREWKLLGNEVESSPLGKELALREPQIKSAQATLDAAKSALDKAKLDLSRTVIRAPFNCWVKEETVDTGQLVSSQNRLAVLVGADAYWVQAAIQTKDLPFIFLPGVNAETGSNATVIHDAGFLKIERKGKIIRLLGNLSEQGRMSRVLIQIDDPLNLKSGVVDGGNYPLMLDAYVRVNIEGQTLQNAVSIPEIALREGNRVWVRDPEGRLQIREVTVLRRRPSDILIAGDIQSGEQVVTSMLSAPLPGVKLSLSNADSAQLANSPNAQNEG